MAEGKKVKGTVIKFLDTKGYGFIHPDDGGDDLFVHQSSIKSDGYRSLQEGQAVEFSIEINGDKSRAIDVTAPGGGPLEPSRRGYGSDRRNNGDGYGNNCYTCGGFGHIARDCATMTRGGGAVGVCYNCGDEGHMARDCIATGGGGGGGRGYRRGSGRGCYSCGDEGHLARDCTVDDTAGGGGGYVRGSSGACYTCGDEGHLARDCRNGDGGGGRSRGGNGYSRGSGGAGAGGGNCYNCGGSGHFARDCKEARQ